MRESDVRAMLRLTCEIAELPRDTTVRMHHMLDGFTKISRARSGTATLARHTFAGAKRKIELLQTPVVVGLDDRDAQAAIGHYVETLEPADPLSEPLYSQPGLLVTRGREQLLGDGAWHRSAHFNEVRRLANWDDCIAAKVTDPQTGRVQTICLHKAFKDGRFAAGQWQLLHLFLSETRGLFMPPPQAAKLPPRVGDLLERFLTGASLKEAAHQMRLSVHTVRDYSKVLYRRCGVNSRAELMAKFVHSR